MRTRPGQTGVAGRDDALNPVELLLAALAACMIKGIERVAPMIHFRYEAVEVTLEAIRQDGPPRIIEILCEELGLSPEQVTKFGGGSTLLAPADSDTTRMERKQL